MKTNTSDKAEHNRGTKSKSTYAEIANKAEEDKCKKLGFRVNDIVSHAILDKTPRSTR